MNLLHTYFYVFFAAKRVKSDNLAWRIIVFYYFCNVYTSDLSLITKNIVL